MDLFRGGLGLLSMAIMGLACLLVCWTSWRHHRAQQNPANNFHGSILIELLWVVAPFIIVWALVWPTARDLWLN